MPPPVDTSVTHADRADRTDANHPGDAAGWPIVGAPWWLWAGTLLLSVWLAAHSTVGVVMAMAGVYRTAPTLVASVAATALAVPLVRRVLRSVPTSGSRTVGHLAAVAAVALAAGAFWYSAHNIGQHVITQRDPGSYTTTARWLSRTGELRSTVAAPELDEVGAEYFSPAVYEVGAGVVEFQFAHGPSVVLATAFDVAGQRALFAASAAVGVLAVLGLYLLLTTVSRSILLPVAGMAAIVASAPFIYVTRNTYSEPFVMALLLPAIAVAVGARGRWQWPNLALISVLIGASMSQRIDAELYVIAFITLLALLLVRQEISRRWAFGAIGLMGLIGLIGVVDVRVFAGEYLDTQRGNVRLLDGALTVAVVSVFLASVPAIRRQVSRAGQLVVRAAAAIAGLTALALVALWLVRPAVHEARADWEPTSDYAVRVEGLQMLEGLEVDGLRSYGELSVMWLSWYFGPVTIALAIAGFGVLAYRFCRGVDGAIPLAVVAAIGVPVYLWNPSITPEHLWATRRFIPLIMPAFVVAAVIGADTLLGRLRGRTPRIAATALVIGSMVTGALVASWPIRRQADQADFYPPLVAYCWHLGSAEAVLQIGDNNLAMTTRAWCGIPAGWLSERQARAGGAAYFVQRARERCTPVRVVAETGDDLRAAGLGVGELGVVEFENTRHVEPTLSRRPERFVRQRVDVVIAAYDPSPTCRRVGTS